MSWEGVLKNRTEVLVAAIKERTPHVVRWSFQTAGFGVSGALDAVIRAYVNTNLDKSDQEVIIGGIKRAEAFMDSGGN